jgi:hypothetical protein
VERRFILATLAVAIAGALPASASAATAPSALQLTTPRYVSPAHFTWTPADDVLNTAQTVWRAPGACTTPPAAGQNVATYDNTRAEHFALPGDGTWCFFVRASDAEGGTADSPGLTLTIDTTPPTSTIAVSPAAPGGILKGVVNITRTAADATSGVATNVRRVGPVGDCADDGTDVLARWDTTRFTDGTYDLCNVVTDLAGYTTTATLRITIANAVPVPAPIPSPAQPAAPAPAVAVVAAPVVAAAATGTTATGTPAANDKIAPHAPTKVAVVRSRSRSRTSATLVPLTLRWVNPKADDLDRVVVVLNLRRQPRGPADGTVVYTGLRPSATFKLRAGLSGYVALFAVDSSGNASDPARRTVSLASLIPLRPLTGSKVNAAPRLTWEAKDGTAYYNVQVFRDGKRILTDWPSTASIRLPARLLEPGTYTWFVWPALKGKGSAATFGDLIGRATFVYAG